MNETFKKSDIKAGYVVKLRNGNFMMAMPVGSRGSLILIDAYRDWEYLSVWGSGFDCDGAKLAGGFSRSGIAISKGYDIVEVYGTINGTIFYGDCGDISPENRPLLWTRTPPKKMTVSEISEALGYPVEIVAEDHK